MAGAVPDKVLAPLAGRPVFAHSAAAFAASGVADLYVVVYRDRSQMTALSAFAPTPSLLVKGGRERQDSVSAALEALPGDIGHVFIHDCARPLIRPEQLVALHKIVRREQAVVLAHRVTDTIKEKRGGGRLRTIDRSRLWAMETPQVFSKALIERAYARVRSRKLRVTDDAAAVELLGYPVALLENIHPNPKLTAPQDLAYVEFLLAPAPLQDR
jgi:2-C-methyl-D-erythritol 4-phosphate cytidylyltransferase